MIADRYWYLAGKWRDMASDIDMDLAEYDADEKDLPEVHMLQLEAETLRKCACELLAHDKPQVSTEEEIKF
jgi:hypothetical protein